MNWVLRTLGWLMVAFAALATIVHSMRLLRGEFDFANVPEQAGEAVGGFVFAILIAGVGLALAGKLRIRRPPPDRTVGKNEP